MCESLEGTPRRQLRVQPQAQGVWRTLNEGPSRLNVIFPSVSGGYGGVEKNKSRSLGVFIKKGLPINPSLDLVHQSKP